jgi:hypothetical protein
VPPALRALLGERRERQPQTRPCEQRCHPCFVSNSDAGARTRRWFVGLVVTLLLPRVLRMQPSGYHPMTKTQRSRAELTSVLLTPNGAAGDDRRLRELHVDCMWMCIHKATFTRWPGMLRDGLMGVRKASALHGQTRPRRRGGAATKRIRRTKRGILASSAALRICGQHNAVLPAQCGTAGGPAVGKRGTDEMPLQSHRLIASDSAHSLPCLDIDLQLQQCDCTLGGRLPEQPWRVVARRRRPTSRDCNPAADLAPCLG